MKPTTTFPVLLTRFFSQRLIQQRHVSPHTISSYRDTFRLLLQFATGQLGKDPSDLTWDDIDAQLIGRFLDDLQTQRGSCTRSRNLRLTAIRSFFSYAAFELPERADHIQRVLAIPSKRYPHQQVPFLSRQEVDALLAAPDPNTWSGRRDHAWLLLAVQTGVRLSELTGLKRDDTHLGSGAYVHVLGKGRKERCIPLTKQMTGVLHAWLKEPTLGEGHILFPNRRGDRLSNDGIQYLLAKHVSSASEVCPSLHSKRISPHVLRHTAAMELLQAGVDTTVIALWLGHESVETTRIYLARIIHAPLSSRWSPPKMRRHVCYQAPDERCSSLNRSGVIRFHVSALCQVLSRAASRRTGILVRHDHHGSNEVEPTWRRAIKAIGTVPCLIDSPAP